MAKQYNVAILGATGAVGTRMISQLEQSTIPVKGIKLLASKRSAGKQLEFNGQPVTVEEAKPSSFDGIDLVLSSAGGSVSKALLPEAVKRGAVCVDNTSAFRYDPEVPLVVPEVNPDALDHHHGIVANPNCSTIQMVMALEPVRRKFGLKQIIVSTYQAAGGAGQMAMEELKKEASDYLAGKDMQADAKILPTSGLKKHYPLAFNLLPQIDVFRDSGYSREEWKMIKETKKIMLGDMDAPDIKVTATCVRVPVPIAHGESVYFTVEDQSATVDAMHEEMAKFPNLVVQDDPQNQIYPQPINAVGHRETFVGRLRPDYENKGAFNCWVVADNLLKGAAWNAVENAEYLVDRGLM